ncbi:MAG: hypothetical protein LC118_19235 [Dehalococcoidia bacterium]|nr:hypothetical protein [Dehalococcoidia bacterium]
MQNLGIFGFTPVMRAVPRSARFAQNIGDAFVSRPGNLSAVAEDFGSPRERTDCASIERGAAVALPNLAGRSMDTGQYPGDEQILGRLREATGEDASVRQLRRRYDSLRRDYESLLDRLSELEDRVTEPEDRPHPPGAMPATPGGVSARMSEALALPLVQLRDEYLAAATRIQGIVSGLERLAAGAMKGQHGIREPQPQPEPAPPPQPAHETPATPASPAEPGETRPRKVSVEVRGKGFGELLDFQERLSTMPGVSRVSINTIDAEHATLVVELRHAEPPGE